jgi:hypothetical protein
MVTQKKREGQRESIWKQVPRTKASYTHLFPSFFYATQYLYTLSVSDIEKAEKLTQSLPPGLQRKDI